MATDGAEGKMKGGQELVLHPTGDSDGRGGLEGCGDIRRPPLEHCRTVHSDQTHHGYVSGIRVAP